jgi:hypothetical protein
VSISLFEQRLDIGYPSDHIVQNYKKDALNRAQNQILLGGARLANLLDQELPHN